MKPPVIPFVPLILKGESRFQAMFLSTLSMPHSDRPSIPSQFSSVCGYKERSPQDECGLGEGKGPLDFLSLFCNFYLHLCVCVCVCVGVCVWHLFSRHKCLFLQFLLGYLFLLCSLLSGSGTVCSFSVRIVSMWQGGLMYRLI